MTTNALLKLAIGGLLSVTAATLVQAGDVQDTYLGKLEYQGQSITKDTAEFLHRRILEQRATQLVTWARR